MKMKFSKKIMTFSFIGLGLASAFFYCLHRMHRKRLAKQQRNQTCPRHLLHFLYGAPKGDLTFPIAIVDEGALRRNIAMMVNMITSQKRRKGGGSPSSIHNKHQKKFQLQSQQGKGGGGTPTVVIGRSASTDRATATLSSSESDSSCSSDLDEEPSMAIMNCGGSLSQNLSFSVPAGLRIIHPAPAGKKIRIATKSIRCLEIIDMMIETMPPARYAGLMTFTARESYALVLKKKYGHILLAYPTGDEASARLIAKANALYSEAWKNGECAAFPYSQCHVAVMVDSMEQVLLLQRAAHQENCTIPVWIDVDMSWKPFGVHLGVRRSPIRNKDDAQLQTLMSLIGNESHVYVEGIMGYEAQLAGLQDYNLSDTLFLSMIQYPLRRLMKHLSMNELMLRRKNVFEYVRGTRKTQKFPGQMLSANEPVQDVQCNGGGSGSIHATLADESVTEITIGSGALGGHLFDGYHEIHYEPALFFALRVTRVPKKGKIVTCHGGGWIASGPAAADRMPTVVYPSGAKCLPMEGFGEVQTPILLPYQPLYGYSCVCPPGEHNPVYCGGSSTVANPHSQHQFGFGDYVVCRPAKSGELGDVFSRYFIVSEPRHHHHHHAHNNSPHHEGSSCLSQSTSNSASVSPAALAHQSTATFPSNSTAPMSSGPTSSTEKPFARGGSTGPTLLHLENTTQHLAVSPPDDVAEKQLQKAFAAGDHTHHAHTRSFRTYRGEGIHAWS